jgi:hypothetical protein
MSIDRNGDAPARQRLEALVARLSNAELMTPMAAGWTVAAVLAHLAFWDRRAAQLVERWQQEGVGPSAADIDAVNDAAKAQWLALPPRVAAEQAIEAARAADAALDAASPDLLQRIVDLGDPINPRRGVHRNEHLDEIEHTLQSS